MSRQNSLSASAGLFSRCAMATLIASLGIMPVASFVNVRPAIAQILLPEVSAPVLNEADAAIARLIPSTFQSFIKDGKLLRDEKTNLVIVVPIFSDSENVMDYHLIDTYGHITRMDIPSFKILKIDSSYTSYYGAPGTTKGSTPQTRPVPIELDYTFP